MRGRSIRLFLFLFSIFASLSQTAVAAPSLEDYGRLPAVSNLSISPNGNYIAFRGTRKNQDSVIVYSEKEKKYIAAIDVSKIDPNDIFFHSDDILILVVSQHKRPMYYRHAMDISTAFSYNFRKKTIEPLIRLGETVARGEFITPGQTGMGRILGSSPDQEYVYMPAFVSDSQFDNSPAYSLLRIKTTGKGRPRIHTRGDHSTIDYFLDNQGNVLAKESYNNKQNIHKIIARQNQKWVTIYKAETEIRTRNFVGVTADFKQLVFTSIEKDSDRNAYFTMQLSDGKVDKWPYDRADADIERTIYDKNRVVVGIAYSGLSPSYRMFDKNRQQQMDNILARFPEHSVYLIDWSQNWDKILIKVEGSNYSGQYYSFPKSGQPTLIATAYPKIESQDVNPLATVKFKARDGRIIPTLLTIPRNRLNDMKNLPAVILPHGGPASYDSLDFDFMAQALASRGLMVIQPQFRGSTGFGHEHWEAGNGEWGKKMQDDITDAVSFVVKKGFVNPKRVCIAGASYGGYAALAGAAFTPDIYQCAVSIAGISHIPKVLSADKSRYGKYSWVLSYFEETIGDGKLDKKELREISPYFHADKIKIPVLLIHGVDDTVVEYEQSKIMHSALKKAKVSSKLVKLKKEDHYLRDSETRLQCLEEMVSFILSHIGEKKAKQ